MKRETLLAIVIGAIFGVAFALYFANLNPFNPATCPPGSNVPVRQPNGTWRIPCLAPGETVTIPVPFTVAPDRTPRS